jgi:puromycin-sensitive aminopeptidase
VPEHLEAISNGEVESERHANGRKTVTFSPSPSMSSYLLAFIVGELESVEAKTKRGVVVRGWTTAGKKHLARYAVDFGAKVVDYYEEYFNREYPLPKLDMIALPSFGGGAMENWGAITYREQCMLVDEENASQEQLRIVAAVVAHEIAHQWFGNLTTMAEWSGLYLNESFATHLGTKVVDHLYPEWEVWKDFVADECCNAMRLDGMRSTHPVEVPVPCSRDIDEIFDDISYDKGGSLLRMLESHIGETAFRDGLRIYMLRNAYNNTRTRHLWEALEYVTKKPIGALMSKWTDAPGYPVIRFMPKRVKNDLHLRLSQNRFLYDGEVAEGEWNVPIKIATRDGDFEFLLSKPTDDVVIPDYYDGQSRWLPWYYPNAGRTGFYRCDVAEIGHRGLMTALNNNYLSPEERLGVEDDAYALCRAGIHDINRYRDTVSYYRSETNYAVWSSLLTNLGSITELLCDHPAEAEAVRTFIRNLTEIAVFQVDWEPNSDLEEKANWLRLRPLVLGYAGRCGNMDVCKKAEELFAKALTNLDNVHPDLRETVYMLAASRCGPDGKRLNSLMSIYYATESQEEQDRVLSAIGGVSDAAALKQVYELIISSTIRSQDAPHVLDGARANPALPANYGWEFVKAHWSELVRRYDGSVGLLGLFVKKTTMSLATQVAADEIEAFFQEHPTEGLTMTVAQAVERVRINAKWLDRNLPLLTEWSVCHATTTPPPASEPQQPAAPAAEQSADDTTGDC